MALAGVLSWLAATMQRDPYAGTGLKGTAAFILALVAIQILFGAAAVWSQRNPYVTTVHVMIGALLLATVFTFAWWTSRPLLEHTGEPAFPSSGLPIGSSEPARS